MAQSIPAVSATKQIKQHVPEILSATQVAAIFAEMTNLDSLEIARRFTIHQTLHKAGLRATELLDLRPEDINIDEEFPYIRVQCGKGGKQRHVPISTALESHLRDWMAIRPASEWFFSRVRQQTRGTQMLDRELRYLTQRAGMKAGIRGVHPHMWRHTCATDLLSGGLATMQVARFLGHADVKTTQIYLHVRDEDLWAKVEASQSQSSN